jgi:hypothetical protein
MLQNRKMHWGQHRTLTLLTPRAPTTFIDWNPLALMHLNRSQQELTLIVIIIIIGTAKAKTATTAKILRHLLHRNEIVHNFPSQRIVHTMMIDHLMKDPSEATV